MVVKHAEPVKDQVTGMVVDQLNQMNQQAMNIQLDAQHIAFEVATEQMQKVRDFIANPSGILGSMSTKHGEIAEQVEVVCAMLAKLLRNDCKTSHCLKLRSRGWVAPPLWTT